MLVSLSLRPAAHLAVERATAALVHARAVLAAKRQIAERAREFCSGAEIRADGLQNRMIGMRLVSPRRPPSVPAARGDRAVVWRRADC
jgi:hypothetical protein